MKSTLLRLQLELHYLDLAKSTSDLYMSCMVCEAPQHHDIFKLFKWTLVALGTHFRVLYQAGVFVCRTDAMKAVECGWKMLDPWLEH